MSVQTEPHLFNPMEIEEIRKEFPFLLKQGIYFDSAATAQKPRVMVEALGKFYREDYATVNRAVYRTASEATERYHGVRENLRRFLNAARSEEIIFTRGTTDSINLVAFSFGKSFIQPGDEILISTMEHHSNIVPWQMMCEERGAHLKVIPLNELFEIDLQAYRALFSPRTKLVAIAHISNALGVVNPVKEMIQIAHEAGAYVLVDGAQSAPHLKIDLQDLDADFFVFSSHKLYGPTGLGVLYGKYDLLNRMTPYQGGGDMIAKVSFEKTTYNTLPFKFEAGTPPIAEVIGLGASLDYIQKIGMDRIHRYECMLLDHLLTALKAIPEVAIIGDFQKRSSMVSFTVKGCHHLDIGMMLDAKNIAIRTGHHCAQPLMAALGLTGTCRVSLAFYNTKNEIDQFVRSLIDVIRLLA